METSVQTEKKGILVISVKGIKKAFGDIQDLKGVHFEL